MIKEEFRWNPIYCLVMEIKQKYIEKFNDTIGNFEIWLEKLNCKEYNDFFECLQINQKGNLILIRYGVAEMQTSMWQDKDSLYRECRSVVIDIKNNNLVSVPFRKFFNINEVEENKEIVLRKEIEQAKIFEITNKLDGSLQQYRYYMNEIYGFGSMALRPEDSWRLQDGYSMLTDNHKKMIKENPDLTFIFEYISMRDCHVVKYKKEEEGLYLIGIRNVYNGREFPYKIIKCFSKEYSVPMTKIENLTLDEVLEKCKTIKASDKEGFVLNIDGRKIKIKNDDYVKLHRMLDKVSSINVIIENIANNTFDDLVSKIPDSHKDRVMKIANKIIEWKMNLEKEINDYYNKLPKGDKKEIMIWIDANCEKSISGYIKCKYLRKEYNVLKRGNGGIKKLKELGICENYTVLFSDLEI